MGMARGSVCRLFCRHGLDLLQVCLGDSPGLYGSRPVELLVDGLVDHAEWM